MQHRTRIYAVAVTAIAIVIGGACSSDDDPTVAAGAATSSTAAPSTTDDEATTEPLRILVSNDDGVGAHGIDALVSALSELDDVEVIVAAPAEEQSGTGASTTDGELEASKATTLSGHPAYAVDGFPADSVIWALGGGIDVTPHLVITGINAGQNVGAVGDQISGTVGAARAAAAHGIPALATSSGFGVDLGEDFDFETAAQLVVSWVEEHRDDLLAGTVEGEESLLVSLNVPSCEVGEVRGVAEVTMSPTSEGAIDAQDCTSTAPATEDEITTFNSGFATLAELPRKPSS